MTLTCKSGDIVVRIRKVKETLFTYPKNDGDMWVVTSDTTFSDGRAAYGKTSSAPRDMWRHATREEKDLFNQGSKNVYKIHNASEEKGLRGFIVRGMSPTEYKEFSILCKHHRIGNNSNYFEYRWTGAYKHYGIHNTGEGFKTDYINDKISNYKIFTITEFKQHLIQLTHLKPILKDEKSRIIEQVGRCKTKGTSISSSIIRQVTTTSRPVGNKARGRVKNSRVRSSKICTNTVSC